MTTIRLECHDDEENKHKYYEMSYYDGSYVVEIRYGRLPGYGRRGTVINRKRSVGSDDWARRFIEQKLKEKYRKGYTDIGSDNVGEHIDEESNPLESEPVQWAGIMTRIAHM